MKADRYYVSVLIAVVVEAKIPPALAVGSVNREQKSLSQKYENLKKGEVTQRTNIQKQKLKVQKLCTEGYFGNLRLWSVQELVSRYDSGQSKAYTVKQ